jgi:hypothetical protein
MLVEAKGKATRIVMEHGLWKVLMMALLATSKDFLSEVYLSEQESGFQ